MSFIKWKIWKKKKKMKKVFKWEQSKIMKKMEICQSFFLCSLSHCEKELRLKHLCCFCRSIIFLWSLKNSTRNLVFIFWSNPVRNDLLFLRIFIVRRVRIKISSFFFKSLDSVWLIKSKRANCYLFQVVFFLFLLLFSLCIS